MPSRITLTTEAFRDLLEARDWYEGRSTGLGEEFLLAVESRFRTIEQNSQLAEVVQDNCRRSLVDRFPYVIYYEDRGHVIIIYAVLHGSRHPRAWQERLPRR
jgi:plasmid stabilization system protein ParE